MSLALSAGEMPVVLVAFLAMEAVSYLAHRFVMHGPGMGWHRSHHSRQASRWEKNDLFPVTFAAITVLAMAAGTSFPSLRGVYVAGVGVTLYGLAYLFVHDVYIHGRLGRLPELPVLEHLKDAHRIHHLFGGEPYGMLFPIVPKPLKARARARSFQREASW
jgi:beta-carotene 3-hydroxylase